MSTLRAASYLAEGANELFQQWVAHLRTAGFDIDTDSHTNAGTQERPAALTADVVFACGLLTAQQICDFGHLNMVATPIFPGETNAVYRSVVVARADTGIDSLQTANNLRLAVNEYGSWSGWHGLKAHLRLTNVPGSAIGEHVISGGHVRSIEAVLDSRADIASIDSSVWVARSDLDPRLADLTVIDTTKSWPAPPISLRSSLPSDISHRLTQELLALPDLKPAANTDYDFMLDETKDHPTWP